MQSGKPVAVFETHPDAPRVLIANSNLVPQWATWEHFRALDAAGLMMYGQMTAGSWIYIGTQGILQGTYETFAAVARKRFGGTLAGRLVVTAGLGGMGGAQPLAVTMNGGCALCVEVDLQRIERRIETGYLDERAADLDDALRRLDAARGRREALSIGLLGNAAEVLPELVRRGAAIDVVTDQTSAHDPLNGYVPAGLTVEQADALRASDPDDYLRRVGESAVAHVAAIRLLQEAGAEAFDYGNALRGLAAAHGDADAFAYPGFVPAYIRPLFCEGKGPFRWVALSGDPADIHATDDAILELFGDQEHIARWIALARERVHFQGLPARICWLGYGERDRAGVRFNEMVASGELRGAGRHRARPPRRRLGRLAPARDRVDGRRLGRRGRLAAAQRDGQRRLRRLVGLHPPRRRRRDGALDPRRPGVRGRRHPGGGRAHPPRPDRRPRHGHRAPRRRRRAARRGGGRAQRGADADARSGVSASVASSSGALEVLRPRPPAACPTCATTAPASWRSTRRR